MKYIVIGTATSASVVIAGKVSTTAARLRTTASAARPAAGKAAPSSVSGFPIARNSGTTSTSSTVCVARA